MSTLRAEVGRFCQFNCFQEAVVPILRQGFACRPASFDYLRFVGLIDLIAPLRTGTEPGGFGGMPWPRLAEAFSIDWRWAPADMRLDQREIEQRFGNTPFVAVVDRYHVPKDDLCWQVHHRPHAILVVGTSEEGLAYSDSQFPNAPELLPWTNLREGVWIESTSGRPFLVGVDAARDLNATQVRDFEVGFLISLAAEMARPVGDLEEVLALFADLLDRGCEKPDRLYDVDLMSFFNGAGQTLKAARRLLEGAAFSPARATGEWFAQLAEQVDGAYRLMQMYVEFRRPRHRAKLRERFGALATHWRDERRDALASELGAAIAAAAPSRGDKGPDSVVTKRRPTIVLGVIGADVHVVGNQILRFALEAAGMAVTNLGVQVSQEEFLRAAVETRADAILVGSLYGHGEIDCREFRKKAVEMGIGDILMYVGGNLVVGDRPWAEVERYFLALGFDRAYSSESRPEQAIADLRRDLAARSAPRVGKIDVALHS